MTIVARGCYGGVGAASVAALSGVKGKLRHALIAKANLDEDRSTPGAHTPYPGGSMISQAASTAESLAYLAQTPRAFAALLANFTNVYNAGVLEAETMVSSASAGNELLRRNYSLQMMKSAA